MALRNKWLGTYYWRCLSNLRVYDNNIEIIFVLHFVDIGLRILAKAHFCKLEVIMNRLTPLYHVKGIKTTWN